MNRMKNQTFLVLTLISISFFQSYSQIIFEKGYYINESDERIECLIKNVDWRSNPTEFEYKLSENAPSHTANIATVKEFAIDNASKYIRAKTKIDRSSDKIDIMSDKRNPDFKEELLFLKVLIEGQASLYQYIDNNLTRFFYKIKDSEINQLVHKKYLIKRKIRENNYFKMQLYQSLKCEDISLDNTERLKYSKKSLVNLFVRYHKCINGKYVNHEPKRKKILFNLSLRPSAYYGSLKISNSNLSSWNMDFGSNFGFKFGVEAELILPFNKNKWGILFEPTYQHYKSEKSKEVSFVSGGKIVSKVDYKSIEFAAGIRHYFFLNDDSKLFANISLIYDISRNSTIRYSRQNDTQLLLLEGKSSPSVVFGVGYQAKDTYSIEMRYTSRNIVANYAFWISEYRAISVVFGYSIL